MANKTFIFSETGETLCDSKAFNCIDSAIQYAKNNTGYFDNLIMQQIIIVDFEFHYVKFMRIEKAITINDL